MHQQALDVVGLFVLTLDVAVRLTDGALDNLLEVSLGALAQIDLLRDAPADVLVAPVDLVEVIRIPRRIPVFSVDRLLLRLGIRAEWHAVLVQTRQQLVLRGCLIEGLRSLLWVEHVGIKWISALKDHFLAVPLALLIKSTGNNGPR